MMGSLTEADGKAGFTPMAKNIFILKNKLPLVITTGLLASAPVIPAAANQALTEDTQWVCQQSPNGEGWECGITPRTKGPVPFAQRATVPPPMRQAPDIPVTVTGTTSSASAAQAAVAPTAPADADVSVLPVAATAAGSRSETVEKAFATLDWRKLDELPIGQQNSHTVLMCEGSYVEPYRPGLNDMGDPSEAPIYAEADESSYQESGQGTLTGNVIVRQGYRQVESDVAHVDRSTNEAGFIGNVVIREPNLLLVGERADINMDSGRAEVFEAQYVFHEQHSRGEADNILRRESGIINLENASYTTCPPGGCTWQMNSEEVELNPLTGFGTATHATVDMWGIPVFYTPWITFPLDDRRKSGLLFPTISYSSDDTKNGFDYTQPIYWNIAPNRDATITPRIMTNRGALVEGEYRYLTESARGVLGGAYSTPDKVKKENRNYNDNRWFVNLKHEQQLSHNWDYRINYTDASDRDYFDDFGTSLDVRSFSPLYKEIYTDYQGGGSGPHQWNFSLGTQDLENMTQDSDDPYNKAIDMAFVGGWDIGSGFAMNYVVDYTDFKRDQDWKYRQQRVIDEANDVHEGVWSRGSGVNNAVGGRLYLETGASYRFENSYSFLEPGIRIRSVNYRLDRLDQDYIDTVGSKNDAEKPGTTAPTYSLDGGLLFDRPATFGNMRFTQTLEPRARYVYTPDRNRQGLNPDFDTSESTFTYNSLWRDDRFSGYDRIGDTNQLSLGLTSRFLEENGYERFRFSIGQIFYFEDRNTFIDPKLDESDNNDTDLDESRRRILQANRANRSPIATQLVWNVRKDLRLTQDWTYNTDQSYNQDYTFGVQYLPQAGSVINARYRYRNQVDRAEKWKDGPNKGNNTGRYVNGDLEEADFSAVWPLNNQWSLLGRYTYDFTNRRNMERSFGIEQDSCCYMMRVMYRNWIDPTDEIDTADTDKGIFFEFVLKGLGNVSSSRVTAFLNDISGYSSR